MNIVFKLPKNLYLILKRLSSTIFISTAIFCLITFNKGLASWAYSAILGSSFSFVIFVNLLKTQQIILESKNKASFFIQYITRLILYSIPVILGLTLKNYLTLKIILVFLLSFQAIYVLGELLKNWNKYKKRYKHG